MENGSLRVHKTKLATTHVENFAELSLWYVTNHKISSDRMAKKVNCDFTQKLFY